MVPAFIYVGTKDSNLKEYMLVTTENFVTLHHH